MSNTMYEKIKSMTKTKKSDIVWKFPPFFFFSFRNKGILNQNHERTEEIRPNNYQLKQVNDHKNNPEQYQMRTQAILNLKIDATDRKMVAK